MSAPFKAGDKVVSLLTTAEWHARIASAPHIAALYAAHPFEVPDKGPVYHVREAVICPERRNLVLRLHGIALPFCPYYEVEISWTADRFRRVWTQEVGQSLVTTNSDSATQ